MFYKTVKNGIATIKELNTIYVDENKIRDGIDKLGIYKREGDPSIRRAQLGLPFKDEDYVKADDPTARLEDTNKVAALAVEYFTRLDNHLQNFTYLNKQMQRSNAYLSALTGRTEISITRSSDTLDVLIRILRMIRVGLTAAIIIFLADLVLDSMHIWKWWS